MVTRANAITEKKTKIGQKLGEVSDKHRFDEVTLDCWLAANVDGYSGGLSVRQFAGGASNPTFLLHTETEKFVLRKRPPWQLLASAHQVNREYRLMAALGATDVPVPVMRGLCQDETVIGTSFYVMNDLQGRIFRDARLPDLEPSERSAIYDSLGETMARLHHVDWQAVGLADFGKPGNYFERQIARWSRQYRETDLSPIPAMEQLIEELPRRIPADASVAIAHGDFRLENMMFHPVEPRIIAVLDWELSTIGHPLADLGYSAFLWHSHNPSWGTLDGVDLTASGIPGEAEWVEVDRRRTGRGPIEDFDFILAFSIFRLAAISHGVHARAGRHHTECADRGEPLSRAGRAGPRDPSSRKPRCRMKCVRPMVSAGASE